MNRLNIYSEIARTGLDEIIVRIIVELFSTLAVVTKQVKQNRPSKSDLYRYATTDRTQRSYICKESFGKQTNRSGTA
jgi:hypothetical protein